jgi:uncharacterized membrane protein
MNQENKPPSVHQVEILISTLLRIGVISSLSLVVLGTILSFSHHPGYSSSPAELARLTQPSAKFPRTIDQVGTGLKDFQGRAVVIAGLLLLIATPVLRVAVSIIAFALQKDTIFVIITSIVLILLLLSFVLGRVEA